VAPSNCPVILNEVKKPLGRGETPRRSLTGRPRPGASLGRLVALVFLLGVAASSAHAAPAKEALAGVDDKWRFYQSPNFELFSRTSDAESRELLHNLELLRAVFAERFKLVERTKLEVTVYSFRTMEDFHAYSPEAYRKSDFFKGFYLARPDRAVIVVAPVEEWATAQRLIFHEYVHHLFRSAGETPPVWFNEGMADLLATIRVEGDELEIGRPHEGRLSTLRNGTLLPLETLFSVDQQSPIYRTGEHTGLFYAESWALLHYWYFGQSDLPRDRIERFLRLARDRKTATPQALRPLFTECFGIDYPEMQRRLERYVETGSYRFVRQPVPKLDDAKSYAMRAVPRDELRLRLAELALRVNRSALGKLTLLDAVQKNPADPRPFEALGTDAMADRDESTARERWEQALDAGSRNAAIYRELGLIESRGWFRQFDYYFQLPPDAATRLRTRLLRSIEDSPNQIAGYEMLAWVEAFAPEPSVGNVKLVLAHFAALTEQRRTLVALAMVCVRSKENGSAKELLDKLDTMEPDPWTAHAAEVVRAKLEGRPVRRLPGTRPGGRPPMPAPITVPLQGFKPPPLEIPGKP